MTNYDNSYIGGNGSVVNGDLKQSIREEYWVSSEIAP